SCFYIYKTVICYDHFKQLVTISYRIFKDESISYDEALRRLKDIKQSIKNNGSLHGLERTQRSVEYVFNSTRVSYEESVEKAKDYIRKGDIFQVVLSQRLHTVIEEHPFQIYRRLRSLNPSPYMFYIEFDGFTVAGASPESLVKVSGRVVETNPIAGTRPRGKDRQQDELFKAELLADEKEKAEHLMLVDLGRNDIGKVSRFGTVKVERFMEIDCYSHVMHMVSTVSGELQENLDCFDALRSCFPAGTVSGAPKIRAMEIIDELEQTRRGIYAGAVGYFSFNGDMDTCIAIRTIVFKGNRAYIQAGAGIVYDSQKDKEYEETLNKLGAMREVI
ncbi:MAG: anthranilate synthase component I family protein, partial [Bacillota bacterium]|nr:anthranilate synthase component I family protein [Bacillota bacterium]